MHDLLFTILGLVAVIVGIVVLANVKEKKDKKIQEEKLRVWLETESTKPKYKLSILTKSGKIYESKVFQPIGEVTHWKRWYVSSWTSLNATFALNRYRDPENDLFIPVCDIETVRRIQSK
jgi:hypothetical protein